MEVSSKVRIISVMGVVLCLLLIGFSKEDFHLKEEFTEQEETLIEREPELATPMYYLIVGSFIDEENANRFGNDVETYGYDLFTLPQTDGFVRIGIFSSPYREDVVEFQTTIESVFPKSWITYQ